MVCNPFWMIFTPPLIFRDLSYMYSHIPSFYLCFFFFFLESYAFLVRFTVQ